jgi:hypothetical protein
LPSLVSHVAARARLPGQSELASSNPKPVRFTSAHCVVEFRGVQPIIQRRAIKCCSSCHAARTALQGFKKVDRQHPGQKQPYLFRDSLPESCRPVWRDAGEGRLPASFSALRTITSRLRRRIQTTTVGSGMRIVAKNSRRSQASDGHWCVEGRVLGLPIPGRRVLLIARNAPTCNHPGVVPGVPP